MLKRGMLFQVIDWSTGQQVKPRSSVCVHSASENQLSISEQKPKPGRCHDNQGYRGNDTGAMFVTHRQTISQP